VPYLQTQSNVRIHYFEYNQDGHQTILLLHGLGASGESWSYQVQPLIENGYHILVPDLRGFGRSTYSRARRYIPALAGDMAAVLHHTASQSVVVAGISLGGVVALQLILDQPDLVEKGVLINAFARLRPKHPGTRFYFILRFLSAYLLGVQYQAHIVAKRIFPRVDQREIRVELIRQIGQADPRGYKATMFALATFNVSDRLSEISKTVLVITGENDNTIAPSSQKELACKIRGARQVIIPNSGHAVIADQPILFNEALLEFLNES
jgi:3-oxoadipate enol-lactonase